MIDCTEYRLAGLFDGLACEGQESMPTGDSA
jgi:hypothetical protein